MHWTARLERLALATCLAAPGVAVAQSTAPAAPPTAAAPAEAPPAAHPEAENSGQDPTRPVARFDVRGQYANLPGGYEQELLTFRLDKPFQLGGGWKINTRVDLPFGISDVPSADNVMGTADPGISDTLIQGLIIAPPQGKFAFAFGSQLIIPTGTKDQLTGGKWKLVPSAAVIYQLPELSRGSFIGLLIRDSFSFAGPSRFSDSNVFTVEPIFNWQLPDRWFVTFSPEIDFDTRDDWKAFVPVDFTIGKKVTDRIVVSLQTDIAVVDTSPDYDWKTELRVGFFF